MKKRSKRTLILIFLVGLFSWTGMTVFAADPTENPAGAVGFAYNIEFPENQVSEAGYFDLMMGVGQKQTINVTLINPAKEEVTVLVGLNGTKTNKNGVVEFGQTEIENDPSLKFAFEDLVKGPDKVVLAPGESRKLELDITMPKTEFDGVILGGIQLKRDDSKDAAGEVSGAQIKNKYQYIIGVTLRVNDKKVQPELALNDVYADQFNYQNAIFVNFSNVKAAMLSDMSIEVQISKQGQGEVIYETKKNAMRLAPNSFINFPVSMQGEKMAPGKYTANILVKGSDNTREEWSSDFEITREEADMFNNRDVGLIEEKKIDWTFIILISSVSLVAIALIYWVITLLQKKKKQTNQSSRSKSRRKKKVN